MAEDEVLYARGHLLLRDEPVLLRNAVNLVELAASGRRKGTRYPPGSDFKVHQLRMHAGLPIDRAYTALRLYGALGCSPATD